jgi:hypothetical protein
MGCSNSYISSNSSRTRSNSYSHTEDNNNISLKFTKFNKEMEKAVPIKNVKKDMEFKYSDYSLSEGSIVFQIGTEDNEIVFQKEINPKDGEEVLLQNILNLLPFS